MPAGTPLSVCSAPSHNLHRIVPPPPSHPPLIADRAPQRDAEARVPLPRQDHGGGRALPRPAGACTGRCCSCVRAAWAACRRWLETACTTSSSGGKPRWPQPLPPRCCIAELAGCHPFAAHVRLQSDVEAQRSLWGNKRSGMVASHAAYMQQLTGAHIPGMLPETFGVGDYYCCGRCRSCL